MEEESHSVLPSLTGGSTTINGYSQPEAAPAVNETPATILIKIDGINTTNQSGLYIGPANNVVQGLACAPPRCNWGRSPCPGPPLVLIDDSFKHRTDIIEAIVIQE
jgi:hypothetical protein